MTVAAAGMSSFSIASMVYEWTPHDEAEADEPGRETGKGVP